MKRFFRFAVKHRTLSKVIAFALGFVVLYVADYIENNVLKFVACGFLGGSYAFLETCFVYLLKEPTKMLGECDPYPLYEESKFLYDTGVPKAFGAAVICDYSAALRYMGELRRAYDMIHNISDNDLERAGFIVRMTYYNNLADCCVALGLFEEADACYLDFVREYEQTKRKKAQSQYAYCYDSARMYLMMRDGNYADALTLCNGLLPQNKLQSVSCSMERARIYNGLGDMENATAQLNFVIENSGKTSLGIEAKGMLEYMNKTAHLQ